MSWTPPEHSAGAPIGASDYAPRVRVLQLVHGFPPREQAGTEVYAARLAEALRAAGHTVLTVAAGPEPGAGMWSSTTKEGLVRLANNAPYAGLRRGASDPHFDRLFATIEDRFRPDLVHVQHLAFASATVRPRAPVVWTLHDAWAWCAAGGLLIREGAPCPGPGDACPRCASGWMRDSPAQITALKLATMLGRAFAPADLQRVWQRVPTRLRRLTNGPAAPLHADHLARRVSNIREFAQRCARIVSPSRWLADEARRNHIPVTDVVPHGVAESPPGAHDGPLVFLGTLAWHKGPDLVAEAWRRSGVDVPLEVYGRPGPDPSFHVANDGPLDAAGVRAVLARARALVLGSRWPENAPLVVLEARAAGCPVIAPDIGGLPELIEEGKDGWLYPVGQVGALSERIRLATSSPLNPRRPRTFTAHIDQLLGVYQAAIQGGHE